jgi:GT2 family glycosyltransferase
LSGADSPAGITAVIPNWNRRELLLSVLDDLARQTMPAGMVIVVDNGSTDGSVEAAELRGAQVIRLTSNQGFARAVNLGIQRARTDWVAILNNDIQLHPEYLAHLQREAVSRGAAFAVGRILQAQERARPVLDGCFDLLSRSGCAWRAGHGRPDSPLWHTSRVVHFAPFTAALFRTALFRDVGLLDEQYESYMEDVEFGLRCAAAGKVGVYVPEAMAWHWGSATLGSWSPAMVRLLSRNQVLLAARYFPLRWLWPVLAGQTLWGLVAIRRGCGLAWLRGKVEGLVRCRRAHPQPAILPLVSSCEEEISALQREAGWDSFWRWYFRLVN